MQAHDFTHMPTKAATGEPENVLRCKWCMKTPMKAREDGCPIHELEETGYILLSVFNPEGCIHFHGRKCVTCGGPIMGHILRKGSPHYWCNDSPAQICQGINDCVFDVEGVVVPPEPEVKEWPRSDCSDPKWDE